MLLAAGCTTPEPEAAPPASSAPPADPEPPFCAAEHVKCGTVTASSGVSASYAVLSAGKPSGAGLVLVELGGPGLDLYSRADPSFVTVPERLRSYDLLMIREPWASAKAGDGCRAALRELGDALSRATARPSAASAAECHTSGWTASAYVAAVRAA